MNVIALQFDIAWEDRAANFGTVRQLLDASDIQPGSLVVLPELFASGFSMDVGRIAEDEGGETEAFLAACARDYRSHLVGGLALRAPNGDGKGRNELAVFGPDGALVTRYRKNYTFRYTGESDYFERGTEIALFDWNGFRVCPVICYDLRFPELFRRGAKEGADLFAVIANWPVAREHHWTTLLRARAIENLACVVGVNRSGTDPKYVYPGRSQIIDHLGTVLADAGKEPGTITAVLDPSATRAWREEFPALLDLR